jgi:beta-lactamase regulating signal transducer with metallopeptidase domain
MSSSPTHGTSVATLASVSAAASATNPAPPDKTDSITIVLSIIGAILTLASVIVAVLQYRIQAQKRRDAERGGRDIEMYPHRSLQDTEGGALATPLS